MDEKLALKFASWLSPRFELWVYDRIQELLTNGETRLQGIPPSGFAVTLRLLAEQWEKQEQINRRIGAIAYYPNSPPHPRPQRRIRHTRRLPSLHHRHRKRLDPW